MTLQQLIYFRTAAEFGSFNAAARHLHCTQPAVSEQVRRLEQELGVSLFARAGRGLTLTNAGRRFLGHAERVTAAAEDAATAVGRRAGREQVTMGTFRNAPYYDIDVLADLYCSRHPEGRLRLQGRNSFDVARAVQDGELDVGLVVLPVDDSLLDVRSLFHDDVLYISSDHGLTQTPVEIEQLTESPLILYDASYGFNDPTRRQLAARAQAKDLLLEPRIEVEHVETALQLVARGLGSTIAARSVLLGTGLASTLSAVTFAEPFRDFFAIATRRGVRVSPATASLVGLVDEWAKTVSQRI